MSFPSASLRSHSSHSRFGSWRSSQTWFRTLLSSSGSIILLAVLALLAILVQGYHFGVDDSAVYLPAVEQRLHPQLFPYGAATFQAHARLSLFAPLLAASSHLTRLPLQWTVLAWQWLGIWLFLIAGLSIARRCFLRETSQWAAVLTLVCVLPISVAGTSLSIMDTYVTARTLSTPLILLSIAALLAKRRWQAWVCLVAAALVHPLMAAVGLLFFLALEVVPRVAGSITARNLSAIALPFGRASEPYRQTILMRGFLYPGGWLWYEWAGVVIPLAALFCMARWRPRHSSPVLSRVAAAAALAGTVATASFLVLGLGFEQLYRLQPMRVFQVVTTLFFLLLGGLVGEYLLQSKPWRWIAFLASICLLCFAIDRAQYPASRHIDWPDRAPRNAWAQAFVWTRLHTPENAIFALPPRYISLPGEEQHGFRAIAERSMLADELKDSGPVSVFPQLAPAWWRDQQLTQGWDTYTATDFQALAHRSPVTWVVVSSRQAKGLNCPYNNAEVSVCRLR